MKEKTYPCGEYGYRLRTGRDMTYVKTGEFRAPRKGEWYLSGAWPEAYMAPNDYPLDCRYHILREVPR